MAGQGEHFTRFLRMFSSIVQGAIYEVTYSMVERFESAYRYNWLMNFTQSCRIRVQNRLSWGWILKNVDQLKFFISNDWISLGRIKKFLMKTFLVFDGH